jgi:hypothetical protein
VSLNPQSLKRQRTTAKVFCLYIFPVIGVMIDASIAWDDFNQGKPFNWLNLAELCGLIVWGFIIYALSMAIFRFAERNFSDRRRK